MPTLGEIWICCFWLFQTHFRSALNLWKSISLQPLPVLSVCRGRPKTCGSVIRKSQELLPFCVLTPLPSMYMESCFVGTEDSSTHHPTAEGQFPGPNVRLWSGWIGHCWSDACKAATVCVSKSSKFKTNMVIFNIFLLSRNSMKRPTPTMIVTCFKSLSFLMKLHICELFLKLSRNHLGAESRVEKSKYRQTHCWFWSFMGFILRYLPGFSLGTGCMVSLRQTADRCKVMVWKLQSSSPVTSAVRLPPLWTKPKTSSFWHTWKLPCCRAVKDKTTSWRTQHREKISHIHCFAWIYKHITKSITSFTWHCPGGIVPVEGSVLKCAKLRKRKLTGSLGQRFCRTHSKSIRWPVTHVRKSNCGEGLGTRATGSPEPVTASSTLLLPKETRKF